MVSDVWECHTDTNPAVSSSAERSYRAAWAAKKGAVMTLLDPILERISPDRRFRSEGKEWQRTGTFPHDVIRVYKKKRSRHSDLGANEEPRSPRCETGDPVSYG